MVIIEFTIQETAYLLGVLQGTRNRMESNPDIPAKLKQEGLDLNDALVAKLQEATGWK